MLTSAATLALNNAAQAQDRPNSVEEVVVTATRSASNVNRVAMAVSAVTQKTIEAQGIKTVDDLARTVPGMTFRKTGGDGNPVVTIRGIGGNGATVGSQTTGVYLDDSALQRRMINGLQTGNGSPFPQLFDLDRVEVLRGPQGTLYGGSSEGGTVRFITPTPSLTTYSGQARGEVSTTKNGALSREEAFAFGGPIIRDKLGFRGSVIDRRSGGWIDAKSVYNGEEFAKDINYTEARAFRGTLKWEVTPTLVVTPAVYIGREYSNAGDTVWGPSPQINYSGSTILNGIGGCNVTGKASPNAGACSLTIASSATTRQAYFFAFPTTTIAPWTQNAMPWYNFDSTGNGLYTSTTAKPTFINSPRTTKLFLPSITVDKDFGWFSVKSISTFVHDVTDGATFSGGTGGGGRNVSRYMYGTTQCRDGYNQLRTAYTATTQGCFTPPSYLPGFPQYADWYNYHNDRDAKSEELRLSSKPGGRLTWIAGGFWSLSKIHMHGLEQNNEDAVSKFYRGIGEAWGIGVTPLPFWGFDSPKPYSLATPYQDISDRNVHLREREWAVFGEATFAITEKFKVTAGGRYSDYTQNFQQEYGGAPAGSPPIGTNPLSPFGGFVVTPAQAQAASANPALPNSATNPITDPNSVVLFASDLAGCPTSVKCPMQYTTLASHEKTFAPKLGLSYQITETNLLYATYAKGFRPGGVNPPVSQLQCQADFAALNITSTPLTYDGDTVDSYEVGNKARLLGGRLQVNTSAFYIDWQKMQFNQTLSCGLAFVNNAGHAISKGAEVQANGRFGPVALGVNIGYNKAEFADAVKTATGTVVQAKGDNVGTPDWTVSLNGQYDFRVANLPGFIRADYNYTGKYQRGPGVGTSAYNPYTVQGEAFGVWNARLGLTVAKVDWSLFVQNLTDAKPFLAYTGGTNTTTDSLRNTGSSLRPRTFGFQGNYRF